MSEPGFVASTVQSQAVVFDLSSFFPMATPNQLTPGYRIYRNLTADGSAFDMTAALNFDPPQGSDELFFALKAAYPAVDNHAERTRMGTFISASTHIGSNIANGITSRLRPFAQ